jgi:hypothetical protein
MSEQRDMTGTLSNKPRKERPRRRLLRASGRTGGARHGIIPAEIAPAEPIC